MSNVIISSELDDFPRYEIRYYPLWESGGRIWSQISNKYLKISKNYKGYFICQIGKKTVKIHRLLVKFFKETSWKPTLVVNHIDHNRANNRLENLELITRSKNSSDHDKAKTISKYQGVFFENGNRKWRARIRVKGTSKHLGYFDSEKEAARARDNYVINYDLDRTMNNISSDED